MSDGAPASYTDTRLGLSGYYKNSQAWLQEQVDAMMAIHTTIPTNLEMIFRNLGDVNGNLLKQNVMTGTIELEEIDVINDDIVPVENIKLSQWHFQSAYHKKTTKLNKVLDKRTIGNILPGIIKKHMQARQITIQKKIHEAIIGGIRTGNTISGTGGVLTQKTFTSLVKKVETDYDIVNSDMYCVFISRTGWDKLKTLSNFQSIDFNPNRGGQNLPINGNVATWGDLTLVHSNLLENENEMIIAKKDAVGYGREMGMPDGTSVYDMEGQEGHRPTFDITTTLNFGATYMPDGVNGAGGNKDIARITNAFTI